MAELNGAFVAGSEGTLLIGARMGQDAHQHAGRPVVIEDTMGDGRSGSNPDTNERPAARLVMSPLWHRGIPGSVQGAPEAPTTTEATMATSTLLARPVGQWPGLPGRADEDVCPAQLRSSRQLPRGG